MTNGLPYSDHLLSKKMCRFKSFQSASLFNLFLWLNKLIVEPQSVKKPREWLEEYRKLKFTFSSQLIHSKAFYSRT
jgi:hypothetical protein